MARAAEPQTAGPHVAAFLKNFCRHTKGRWARQPVEVEPWQQDFLDEAYELDEDGLRVYSEVVLGIPRKNGKSLIGSGLALYHLTADGEEAPEVYAAAAKCDQARIVFGQAEKMIKKSPDLQEFLRVQRSEISCDDNDGIFRVIPSDGDLEHGSNPHAGIVDELWAHKSNKLYVALTTGTAARAQPITVTLTTAGYDKATVLGETYDKAMSLPDIEKRGMLTICRDRENGFLMWWYGPREDETVDLDDPEVWLACNPASWVQERYLKKQRNKPSMRVNDFYRFHTNKWTEAEDSWVEPDAWDACGKTGATIPEKSRVYVTVDAAIKRDTAAVTVMWPRDDGRVQVKSRVWGVKIEDKKGAHRNRFRAHVLLKRKRISQETLREYIREILAKKYEIEAIIYDARYFSESIELLDEFDSIEFQQTVGNQVDSSLALFEAINERRILHDNDPVLRAHVLGGVTKTVGEHFKLVKRDAKVPVDACATLQFGILTCEGHVPDDEDEDLVEVI